MIKYLVLLMLFTACSSLEYVPLNESSDYVIENNSGRFR